MTENIVGILGAGAVGHLLAYFFHEIPGLSIQMQGRKGLLAASKPIEFQNNQRVVPLNQSSPLASLWFCCLKAHSLTDGLRGFLGDLPPGAQIIVLSNGSIEPLLQSLRREFPLVVLRKGLVSRGVKVKDDGSYSIGPKGQVIWGEDREPPAFEQQLVQILAPHGFQWNAQCCRLRREKWYFNTCLNTLCGARRLARNGLAVEQGRDELEALSHEVFALAHELWPDWQPVARELWQNLLRLIASTADNENSMAADVRLGRTNEATVLSGLVHQAHNPEAYPVLLAFDAILQQPG